MQARRIQAVAALFAALGVGCGAFGAHSLRDIVSPSDLDIWDKAVLYHLIHSLAALVIASQAYAFRSPCRIAVLMLAAICVFSGSLYLLVLSGARWLGMITPLGGLGFIVAWILLGIQLLKASPKSEN